MSDMPGLLDGGGGGMNNYGHPYMSWHAFPGGSAMTTQPRDGLFGKSVPLH